MNKGSWAKATLYTVNTNVRTLTTSLPVVSQRQYRGSLIVPCENIAISDI